jgi:tRNA wybutosine-synthesizing protein 3
MVVDKFLRRKKDVLSRLDKSSKGVWDKQIEKLCRRINSSQDYYTTSSCSGRAILMLDEEKKQAGLFIQVWHDTISFEKLKKILKSALIKQEKIKFKMDPCILHVACRDLQSAQKLFDKAKLVGWKQSGIISVKNNVMLELGNTGKLEFPIVRGGNVLVDDAFLKIVIEETNKRIEKGWARIEKLEKLIR